MPTANPSIVIRFGTKKLQRHTAPSRPTIPNATPIAKIPMMIGVTPAISDPKTISRTTIATTTPIVSPFFRSSSEIFLKSAVEVGSPSM